jgi:hypothetical protein
MKKMIIVAALFAASVGAYAQGVVYFNNYITGTLQTYVYGVETTDATVQVVGSTSADYPTGTATYTGTKLSGTGYSAQLWGASATNATFTVTTNGTTAVTLNFRSGSGVGKILNPVNVAVQGVASGSSAVLQLRVWDNSGGTITSYDSAITKGTSGYISVSSLGGGTVQVPNLVGLTSFSLTTVPEPATIALGVIGAAALLLRRRK